MAILEYLLWGKIQIIDSLNVAAFRGCKVHFIDASCLKLQDFPGATGKAWHVIQALRLHVRLLTDLEVQARQALARGSFMIHCKRALCQSVFLGDHLVKKLGQAVCHLALKPKILALGGSWPLKDGCFTCDDNRSIPETISMVSGPTVYRNRPLEPKTILPLGFVLQTGHLTYGPYSSDQDLYQIWLETKTGLQTQGCVISAAELGVGHQLANDAWVLDFSFKIVRSCDNREQGSRVSNRTMRGVEERSGNWTIGILWSTWPQAALTELQSLVSGVLPWALTPLQARTWLSKQVSEKLFRRRVHDNAQLCNRELSQFYGLL